MAGAKQATTTLPTAYLSLEVELRTRGIELRRVIVPKPNSLDQHFPATRFMTPDFVDNVEASTQLAKIYNNGLSGENDWRDHVRHKILIQSLKQPRPSSASTHLSTKNGEASLANSENDELESIATAWGASMSPISGADKTWMDDNRIRQTMDIPDRSIPKKHGPTSASLESSKKPKTPISIHDSQTNRSKSVSKVPEVQNSTSISFGLDVTQLQVFDSQSMRSATRL